MINTIPSAETNKQISTVIRLKSDTALSLANAANALGITSAKATELAIRHWLTLTPSEALGISKEVLYSMSALEGVKIDA